MNERIKELADKIWAEEYWDNPNTDKLLPAQLNKFAELIVRECIQVCEPVLDKPYEDMSEFGKGLVEGQDVSVEKIKQHFGVEP
jgi:hypothetical protein